MLRIRLVRVGKKNSAQFRLVVLPHSRPPKTGKFLEMLGFYNPSKHLKNFNKERILYWISKGAQPIGTVKNMLISAGIMEGKKVRAHKTAKKKPDEKTAPQAQVSMSPPKEEAEKTEEIGAKEGVEEMSIDSKS